MTLRYTILTAALLLAWLPGLRADPLFQSRTSSLTQSNALAPALQSQFHTVLSRSLAFMRFVTPEWRKDRMPSASDLFANLTEIEALHVIADLDKDHGPATLTARYRFREQQALRPYLGGGINRAEYLEHFALAAGEPMSQRISSSIGMATELGAEWQISNGLRLNAELRWLDLDKKEGLLRTKAGLFETDAVSVGLSVDWRFR